MDMKGRVAIPNSFRRVLPPDSNEELYLNKGRDNTIEVHPQKEWQIFENNTLLRLNRFDPESLNLLRQIQGNVRTVKLDSQGRILIPPDFKQYANIKQEVIIIGVGNFFEIWNPEKYDAFIKQNSEQYFKELEKLHQLLELGKNINPPETK